MADDRIQLILDLGQSGKNAAEVRQELEKLDAAAKSVGQTYEVLAISGHGYELVEERIAVAQARSTAGFSKLGDAVAKLTPAQEKAAKASAEMQRGFLSLTNAAQDFQAAGLNGILNNIPQIVTQFGGSAGLAAAIGGAAVAYYAAVPAIKAFWGAVVDGSNDVPKATDKLAAMNEELKTNKDRLKALSDQGSLTNAQLAEYNGLLSENVELERQANAEKERRNGLDALRKKEAEGSAESAAIVKAAIDEAGGVDQVNDAARAKMLAESPEVRDATANANKVAADNADAAANPLNPIAQLKALAAIRKAQRGRDEATKRVENQSSDLIVAASKGDEAAVRELARLMGGSFEQATPEAIHDQNQEVQAVDSQGDSMHSAAARRRAAGGLLLDQDANMAALGKVFRSVQKDADKRAADRDAADAKGRELTRKNDRLVTTPEQAARIKAAEAARQQELAQFDSVIAQQSGGALNNDEIQRGGVRLRNLAKQGIDPMIAAQGVIADLIANQQMLNQRQATQWGQLRARSREVRSQLTRNRP